MAVKQDHAGAFRKYVVEFLGTFFLVMTICMMMTGSGSAMAPWAAGLILVAMMYAGHHVSGGHFNPAISIAAYLRGKLDAGDLLPYITGQFLGGTLAAMLAGFLLSSQHLPEVPTRDLEVVPTIIAELLGTLLFVYVFLSVTSIRQTAGNVYYGLTIGCTFAACLYIFGGISVGAFNPAVALGITMANLTSWSSIWMFVIANVAGGVLAAFLSQYVNASEG